MVENVSKSLDQLPIVDRLRSSFIFTDNNYSLSHQYHSVKLINMTEDCCDKKSFFTPCRRVGLKRKSLGTPSRVQNLTNTPTKVSPTGPTEAEERRRTPRLITSDISEHSKLVSKRLKPLSVSEKDERNFSADQLISAVDYEKHEANAHNLKKQIDQTKAHISKMKEEIKALETISLNAKQHDLSKLEQLIQKWRSSCQVALQDLISEQTKRGNVCTMLAMLKTLGIPASLVHFSETETDFYE